MDTPTLTELQYQVWNGGYCVTGYDRIDRNLIIPEMYNDGEHGEMPVVSIQEAFKGCNRLFSVTIPYSVKTIGSNAFENCKNLHTVTFSEQAELEGIDASAFSGCSSLKNIRLPDSVTYLIDNSFANCTGLTEIVLPDSLVFFGKAFDGCTALRSITVPFIGENKKNEWLLPEGIVVKEWKEGSLYKNFGTAINNIMNVTITGGKEDTFDMSKLVLDVREGGNLTLPANMSALPTLFVDKGGSLTVSEGGRFRSENNCIIEDKTLCFVPQNITEFPISDGINIIGPKVFRGCDNYVDIAIPSFITEIDSTAFNSQTIRSLTWEGKGKYYVKNNCILETESKKLVFGCINSTIPEETTIIGEKAFEEIEIKSIAFSSALTEIEADAFSGCAFLSALSFPATLERIGNHAFSNCSTLSSVTLSPESRLSYIGEFAFAFCASLTAFPFKESLNIDKEAFCCSGLREVVLPPSCYPGTGCFCYCTELSSVDLSDFSYQLLDCDLFYMCEKLRSVTLSDNIIHIGGRCFSDCAELTEISLPSSLKYIGNKAFYKCVSIKDFLIPADVDLIEADAFYGCKGVVNFLFERTVPFIRKMDEYYRQLNPNVPVDVPIDVSTTENNIETFVKYTCPCYYLR